MIKLHFLEIKMLIYSSFAVNIKTGRNGDKNLLRNWSNFKRKKWETMVTQLIYLVSSKILAS